MKKHPCSADSLDFLLDAMCNVFGAILLVAILVAAISGTAILRTTFRDPSEEERKLNEKIALRKAELEAAKAEVELLGALAASRNAPPAEDVQSLRAAVLEAEQRAGEINRLGDELLRMHQKKAEYESRLQEAASFAASSTADRAEALAQKRRELEHWQAKSAEAAAQPERFTPRPLQSADGLQPWRFLVPGKVCEVGSNRAIRTGLKLNAEVKSTHFQLDGADFYRLVPVPEAGRAPGEVDLEKLAREAPPEAWFAELLCAPDAIAPSAQLLRRLRQAGYRVNWRVMPPEGALVSRRLGGHYEAAQ